LVVGVFSGASLVSGKAPATRISRLFASSLLPPHPQQERCFDLPAMRDVRGLFQSHERTNKLWHRAGNFLPRPRFFEQAGPLGRRAAVTDFRGGLPLGVWQGYKRLKNK